MWTHCTGLRARVRRGVVERRSRRPGGLHAMPSDGPLQQHGKPNGTDAIECQCVNPRPFDQRGQRSRDAQNADNNQNGTCPHHARIGPSRATGKRNLVQWRPAQSGCVAANCSA